MVEFIRVLVVLINLAVAGIKLYIQIENLLKKK